MLLIKGAIYDILNKWLSLYMQGQYRWSADISCLSRWLILLS